jgi:TonB family protein
MMLQIPAQPSVDRCQCQAVATEYRSPADTPRCDGGPERVNKHRISGKAPTLGDGFRDVRLSNTMLLFKICIDEKGGVRKVFILRSSGNTALDCHVCRQYYAWRFRPLRINDLPAPSVTYVAFEVHI